MKHFFLLQMMCLLVVACGGGDNGKTPAKPDSASNSNLNADTKSDTAVFVGAFAEWKKQAGETFDGNYDTANQVFKLCSKPTAIRVDRSKITLLNSGNCEDKMSNRFALMILRRDSVQILGDELVSVEIDSSKSKRVYKTIWANDHGQTEFRLKSRDTAHFINATKHTPIINATKHAPIPNTILKSELKSHIDSTKR